MESDFTKRKAIGTFMGAAIGIFLLELLEHAGNIGWWQVLLAVMFSIEIGCWLGVPLMTREVHQAIFSRTHIPKILLAMSAGAFSYIHYKLFLLVQWVANLIVAAAGKYEILEYTMLQAPHNSNPSNPSVQGVFISILIMFVFVGLILFTVLASSDWAPKFFRAKRKWREWIFLAMVWDIVLLPVYFLVTIGLMLLALPLMIISSLYFVFLVALSLLILAGKNQTWAIVFGVMVGILAGAAMGWTHMVLMPTISVMSIGGCAGAASGYLLTKIGKLLIHWEKWLKNQTVMA